MPNKHFDKCLYCKKSYSIDPDTGSQIQAKLHKVHGDLWACEDCLDKYNLKSEGDNFTVKEWDGGGISSNSWGNWTSWP